MPIFIPDTYGESINPEDNGHSERYSMWRHYGTPIKVGYSVLITDGTATTAPGRVSPTADDIANADAGSGEGGKAWFRGGQSYEITSTESTILFAAGYSNITGS